MRQGLFAEQALGVKAPAQILVQASGKIGHADGVQAEADQAELEVCREVRIDLVQGLLKPLAARGLCELRRILHAMLQLNEVNGFAV